MEKILSIVIPTYNMEKYLDKCLTSLIVTNADLMKQLEVLVIIDGATDHSSDIAYAYQNKYPNIFRVIDKENGNYGSCVNRGLKEAIGKYIKILDADDYFHTENFCKFLYSLQNQNNDLIITDFEYVNEKNIVTGRKNRTITPNQTLNFSNVVADFNANLISMHELTYKTDILRSMSYHQTEGISYTDLEWCFIPMTKVNTVLYLDMVVYKYLIGRVGQSVDPIVSMRTLSHKMTSGMNMALQYEKAIGVDYSHMLYINRRISWSIGAIYYNYLVTGSESLFLDDLIKFDSEISEQAPNVYRLLDKEVLNPKLHIRYIAYWRSLTNKHKLPMVIKLYRFFISLYQNVILCRK